MENLIVSQKLPFSSLVKVAEGMSYNKDSFRISARGKQIQRGVEVMSILYEKGRVDEVTHEYGNILIDGNRVPTLNWVVTSHKGDTS